MGGRERKENLRHSACYCACVELGCMAAGFQSRGKRLNEIQHLNIVFRCNPISLELPSDQGKVGLDEIRLKYHDT